MHSGTTSAIRRLLAVAGGAAVLCGASACSTTTAGSSVLSSFDATLGTDTGTIADKDTAATNQDAASPTPDVPTAAADVPQAQPDIAQAVDVPIATPDVGPPVEPVCAKKSNTGKGTSMKPGEACIACHTSQGEGAYYTIAGTVYATPHVVNDCVTTIDYANTKVEVTDANGTIINLNVNSVGNFYYSKTVPAPYKVRVVKGTDSMDMMKSPPSGDCNSCHTTDGANNAPGRILSP